MPGLPDTRHSLLARLSRSEDLEAWSEFVEIYQQAIFQYSRGRGLQDADAWEVVQQVLILVHQKIAGWRPGDRPGAFRAWLWRTAHCVCLQMFRENVRCDRAVGGSDADLHISQLGAWQAAAGEIGDEIRDRERWAFCYASGIVRREVGASTWEAFWLTAVGCVAPQDVALRLGMKVGAVYTAKCRVLARIQDLVRELSWSET